MKLIGVLGEKRHGKDTFSDHYTKRTFAGPLKEACRIIFGLNEEQLYGDDKEIDDPFWKQKPRVMYQFVGTDLFRKQISNIIPHVGDRFWVENARRFILEKSKDDPNVKIIVSDLRFQNEVDLIHELGGTVIKIYRPNGQSENKDKHISEKGIDDIENYDHLIENDSSILDLFTKIDVFVEKNKLH